MFKKVRLKDVLFWMALLAGDLFIYIVFGLLLMGYDDTWDSSKGEYWSLASMNSTEKAIYIGMQVWNAVNISAAVYMVYRIYKRIKYDT